MFKRPRSHKESAIASQSRSKRLKEDRSVQVRPRTQDYINVTYPHETGSGDFLDMGVKHSTVSSSRHQEAEAMVVDSIDQAQVIRYNRLKLQPGGGGQLSRMLHSRVNQCESDTSSLASEEALDSRERQHYNRLKVDVEQIQTNKKLQKGVKILHAQDNSASTSSPQRRTHCSAKVADVEPTKYKKEGHANQLYSVTRAFHSLQKPRKPSSLLPKSKSTGDILRMNHDIGCIGYNVPTHTLTHSKSTHNMESATESCSAMSISDSQSTGSNTAASVSHSPHTTPPTPVIAPPHHHTASSNHRSFINKMINFTCGHEGKEIKSTAYDFSVNILKGAVRKRKSIAFEVGVCLHGPFSFPEEYRLVSPILMVTSSTHSKLKKPIEVILAHCIDILPQSGKNEAVTFFRARKTRKNGDSESYSFEPTDTDTNHFEIHNNHGRLSSTEQGFFCIMSKEVTDMRRKTNYCLVPVVPKHIESSSWRVHYCVTLHLQAFIKV